MQVLGLVYTATCTPAINEIVIPIWESITYRCIAYVFKISSCHICSSYTSHNGPWPVKAGDISVAFVNAFAATFDHTCGIHKNSTTKSWPSNPNVTFPFGRKSPCKESVHNEWF